MTLEDNKSIIFVNPTCILFCKPLLLGDSKRIWHHEIGPAYIHYRGRIEYWENDTLHNTRGPAHVQNGLGRYYLDGNGFDKRSWEIETGKEGNEIKRQS